MNTKASEYLRSVLISPELCVVLVVLLLTRLFPALFQQFASKLSTADFGVQLTVLGSPVVLLGVAWGLLVEKVLHPNEVHRKLLLGWSDYWRLRVRVHASLGWGVVAIGLVLTGFLVLWSGSLRAGVTGILAGVSVAVVIVATSGWAFMVLRDILDNAPDGK